MALTQSSRSLAHAGVFLSVVVAYSCRPDRVVAQFPTGLTTSRWAMDHPEYAEKYAEGAEKTNVPGKIKQAADARFLDGSSGLFLSGGLTAMGQSSNPMGSLELGIEGYSQSYLTQRISLIAAANDDDFYLGGDMGVRLQTPTRLAPFVGLGLFTGIASTTEPAENDQRDNDNDGSIDEWGEERVNFDGALAAIYPEIGAHLWWTSRFRISGFGRYLVTTEGRDADAWYYGLSFAIFK